MIPVYVFFWYSNRVVTLFFNFFILFFWLDTMSDHDGSSHRGSATNTQALQDTLASGGQALRHTFFFYPFLTPLPVPISVTFLLPIIVPLPFLL